jgi:hypothetical protein
MIGFIGTSLQLQSIITAHNQLLSAETSLHSASYSTTARKQLSLSPVNLRHGPRTENTWRTPCPSSSSIVIEVYLRYRCIETAILLLLPRIRCHDNVFSDPLPSNGLFRHNIMLTFRARSTKLMYLDNFRALFRKLGTVELRPVNDRELRAVAEAASGEYEPTAPTLVWRA